MKITERGRGDLHDSRRNTLTKNVPFNIYRIRGNDLFQLKQEEIPTNPLRPAEEQFHEFPACYTGCHDNVLRLL